MARTYRALAALISYPTPALQAATGEIAAVLAEEGLVAPSQRAAIDHLLAELAQRDIYDLQERYFALFDRSRTLSLHLFEHVHGESRDRGQAMADLIELYRGHGLEPTAGELPDFLPLFLEFVSLLPASEAQALLAEPGDSDGSRGAACHPQERLCGGVPGARHPGERTRDRCGRTPASKIPMISRRWMRHGRKRQCISALVNRSTVAAPIVCGPASAPPRATPRPSEDRER